MTLAEYVNNKRYNNSAAILNGARIKIYLNQQSRFKTSASKTETDELARFLNDVYYPKTNTNTNQIYENIVKDAISAYNTIFNKSLQNFGSFGNELVGLSSDSGDTALKALREEMGNKLKEKHHKLSVLKQTLRNQYTQCKSLIELINAQGNKDSFQKLKILLEQTQKHIQTILNEFPEQENLRITVKQLNNKNLKRKLDAIDEAMYLINKITVPSTAAGDLFELSLAYFDTRINQQGQSITNALIDDFKNNTKGVLQGKQKTSGENSVDMTMLLGFAEDLVGQKSEFGQTFNTYSIGIGDQQVTLTDRSTMSRQGKMDINLEISLPTVAKSHSKFRISAKNWLESGDFGVVNLWNALSRTIQDVNVMEHYLYSLGGAKNDSRQLQAAHDLAKLSILMDTLVGYSQENNWVDTLIINLRSKKEIRVEHIPSLIKPYLTGGSSPKLSISYPEGSVRSEGTKLYKKAHSDFRLAGSLKYKFQLVGALMKLKATTRYRLDS